MTGKTNFLMASTEPSSESKALTEICDYLISINKYSDISETKKDALSRVNHFNSLGLYEDDPQMLNASIERKSVHALIYGHDLHDLLEKNNGLLPEKIRSTNEPV